MAIQSGGSSYSSEAPGRPGSNPAIVSRRRIAMGYLYLNSFLYLLFAIWCTAAPFSTSVNLGYLSLTSGGHSEYLVIYGGLQLGLAILFYLLAKHADHVRLGTLVALGLYGPIAVYRAITLIVQSPVSSLTWGTAILEFLLLLGAIISHRSLSVTR
jgi:hypothetical protein